MPSQELSHFDMAVENEIKILYFFTKMTDMVIMDVLGCVYHSQHVLESS